MGSSLRSVFATSLVWAGVTSWASAQNTDNFAASKPGALIARYCIDCHSSEEQKGDLDLERFTSLAGAMKDPGVWQSVQEQLELGEMPPAKKPQPTAEERSELLKWLHETLGEAARLRAGDPGPVVLRRLSNAEYAYTLRDLTGVASLDPAREFPVDGAAGEGFTNAGAALVMSPSLAAKYLDAAKAVAAHMVLLPDGIGFSASDTPRDWTEEKLAAIRSIYARYSVPGGDSTVNLQGLVFSSRDGGIIPLEKYFTALLEERDALRSGLRSSAGVAMERHLSLRYLETLWAALESEDKPASPSFPLDEIRKRWSRTTPADVPALAAAVRQWQQSLWRFQAIGQIGKKGGPSSWQEAVNPVAASRSFELPLPAEGSTISLVAEPIAADSDGESLAVRWRDARVLLKNGESVPLAKAQEFATRMAEDVAKETSRTASYLDAIATAHQASEPPAAPTGLDPELLRAWASATGLGTPSGPPEIRGHLTRKLPAIAGNPDVVALGSPETPSVTANRSAETVRFSTLTLPPRSIFVHPSPKEETDVIWKSPVAGRVRITGGVADADGNCGNGIAWRLELMRASDGAVTSLGAGRMQNGASLAFPDLPAVEIHPGDLLRLAVDPRDGNHACDTTRVSLTITGEGPQPRTWDLTNDTVAHLFEGNPLPDSYGHAGTWHFCAVARDGTAANPLLAAGSLLTRWRDAVLARNAEQAHALALEIQALLTTNPVAKLTAEDAALREHLLDDSGEMGWARRTLDRGLRNADADVAMTSAGALTFKIPAGLGPGARLSVTATPTDRPDKPAAPFRAAVTLGRAPGEIQTALANSPVVIAEDHPARAKLLAGFEDFRRLFPTALCYTRIVPADEVVTLRLFYREDEALRRLMLEDSESAELDRLWRELEFISQSPLKLVDAFEQLWQFSTQDGDPSLLEPMRQPIAADAERFRQDVFKAEPKQVEAVVAFAERAWRRPLSPQEQDRLRRLYGTLRQDKLEHEEAVRLLLARVLTAPAFLYKMESPSEGPRPTPVGGYELATRLSYFLWSSAPDRELLDQARSGDLLRPEVLAAQAKRMTGAGRVRRLAYEFGAQWLHTRGLDELEEKSEKLFPEFASLRGALNEEPVRFFTDLFQNDRPILNLLDADYTFVNGELANFYGIPGISGEDWQRVEGVKKAGRGGALGFGATLAKQSGASRTSPILRGAWVCETLLGERLPKPPKNVPVLAEMPPADLTERQLTEMHTRVAECARCHQRIDPFGFALERFDTIGRYRLKDLAGLEVHADASLSDGTRFDGLDGLRNYLLTQRRDEFVHQFCRKLLGYALGRGVILGDTPLLEEMQAQLASHDYRVGVAIDLIVRSQQFRQIRGKAYSDP